MEKSEKTPMELYKQNATPPTWALKEIQAGRLKGKSDINPQWRIEALTEMFGLCGIGWKYVITKQWIEKANDDEISAFAFSPIVTGKQIGRAHV